VARLRAPAAITYAAAAICACVVIHAPRWRDGSLAPGTIDAVLVLVAAWLVYPVGVMHYLDHVARDAVDQFRPILPRRDDTFEELASNIGTMPAGAVRVGAIVGALALAAVRLAEPALFTPIRTSSPAEAVGLAMMAANFALLFVFAYHSLRHVRMVQRIYREAPAVNIFQLEPLHALSGLTAQTAIAWSVALSASLVVYPTMLRSPLAGALVVMQIVLTAGLFLVPLVEIRWRLEDAKAERLLEANRHLELAIAQLHARVRDEDLAVMHGINKMLLSLLAERDHLEKANTWPWQKGTPTAVASTLIAPLVVLLLQRAIERFALP
jgi:hypothetical protein